MMDPPYAETAIHYETEDGYDYEEYERLTKAEMEGSIRYEVTEEYPSTSTIRSIGGEPVKSKMQPRQILEKAINAVKSEVSRMDRTPQQYATSILKGTTWTVQSQHQTHRGAVPHKVKIIPRSFVPSNSNHHQQQRYQSNISPALERPSDISLHDRLSPSEQVHRSYDEAEDWFQKVDVTKFAVDISKDLTKGRRKPSTSTQSHSEQPSHPKPSFSYSSLIGLALKNSTEGQLTVSEIYKFISENFPYFRTAPSGWKNSVRHNLSLNKCFKKVDIDPNDTQTTRKSCLWMISPDRLEKVESDISKWRERNPDPAAHGLARPQDMEAIEEGTKGLPPMDGDYRQQPRQYSTNYTYKKTVVPEPIVEERNSPAFESIDDLHEPYDNLCMNLNFDLEHDEPESLSPPSDDYGFDDDDDLALSFKRPHSQLLTSPSKGFSDLLGSSRSIFNTPPKKKMNLCLFDTSPLGNRFYGCAGSFDSAHDALNDNSLLSAAMMQSPYKGPVSFPTF